MSKGLNTQQPLLGLLAVLLLLGLCALLFHRQGFADAFT
jgi:hypothetical protein